MAEVLFKDVLIRKVEISVLEKLKRKAKRKNRSLQAEMHRIFRDAAERAEPSERLAEIRKKSEHLLKTGTRRIQRFCFVRTAIDEDRHRCMCARQVVCAGDS